MPLCVDQKKQNFTLKARLSSLD